uniref:PDEase domain-containing protein n=1 Tax=Ascaris lumbricoides TaxID=6252 RepID=A0A0M3HSC7_ASCLU
MGYIADNNFQKTAVRREMLILGLMTSSIPLRGFLASAFVDPFSTKHFAALVNNLMLFLRNLCDESELSRSIMPSSSSDQEPDERTLNDESPFPK